MPTILRKRKIIFHCLWKIESKIEAKRVETYTLQGPDSKLQKAPPPTARNRASTTCLGHRAHYDEETEYFTNQKALLLKMCCSCCGEQRSFRIDEEAEVGGTTFAHCELTWRNEKYCVARRSSSAESRKSIKMK